MKRDLRWGKSSFERRQSAQNLIIEALLDGKKKFKELREITGLSEPALASNLKELHRNGDVIREVDPNDFRVTYYSLTPNGLKRAQQQEDLVFLGNSRLDVKADDFAALASDDVVKIARGIVYALKYTFQKGLICAIERVLDYVPPECVSFSIYSGKGSVPKSVRRLAEVAKSALLVEMATLNQRELTKLSNVGIVFRFNIDKIDSYMKTLLDTHTRRKKEVIKLPDIRDYMQKPVKKNRIDV